MQTHPFLSGITGVLKAAFPKAPNTYIASRGLILEPCLVSHGVEVLSEGKIQVPATRGERNCRADLQLLQGLCRSQQSMAIEGQLS